VEFEAVVRKRRSIRLYQPRPVEEEKIERLLRVAILAPSAGNLQSWEFIVVRDRTTRRRLADAAVYQDFVGQAPVVIVTCANTRRSASKYGSRGANFYCLLDAALASMLILLTAAEEGLGCCYVGAFNDSEVARILGLPGYVRPVGLIPVGYPAEEPLMPGRFPLEMVVHQERWQGG
jgi:nitroreductase